MKKETITETNLETIKPDTTPETPETNLETTVSEPKKTPTDGTVFNTTVKVCTGKKKLDTYIYKIESTDKTPSFWVVNGEIFTDYTKAEKFFNKVCKQKLDEIMKSYLDD